jgi:hypothetical protein
LEAFCDLPRTANFPLCKVARFFRSAMIAASPVRLPEYRVEYWPNLEEGKPVVK